MVQRERHYASYSPLTEQPGVSVGPVRVVVYVGSEVADASMEAVRPRLLALLPAALRDTVSMEPVPTGPRLPQRPSSEMDEAEFGDRLRQELQGRATKPLRPLNVVDFSRFSLTRDDVTHDEAYGWDYFNLRAHAPAPYHLRGYRYRSLPTDKYASFLRELSLTIPRPDREAFTAALRPENLAQSPVLHGPIPTAYREEWVTAMYDGSPSDPDATAPEHRKVELALIRHAVWVGKPVGVTSAMGAFRRNVAKAARLLRRQGIATVVWTDISRELAEKARSSTDNVFEGHDLAAIRSVLKWAQDNHISLVDYHEVYNVEHPMRLRTEAVTSHARLNGEGFAGESDILRLDAHWDFGGLYTDGDSEIIRNVKRDLSNTLDSPYGFTYHVTSEYGRMQPAEHDADRTGGSRGYTTHAGFIPARLRMAQPDVVDMSPGGRLKRVESVNFRWRGRSASNSIVCRCTRCALSRTSITPPGGSRTILPDRRPPGIRSSKPRRRSYTAWCVACTCATETYS